MVDRQNSENGDGHQAKRQDGTGKSVSTRSVDAPTETVSGKPNSTESLFARTVVEHDGAPNATEPSQASSGAAGDTISENVPKTLVAEVQQAGHGSNRILGKVIENRFKVLRVIGEGGMGVVYEAEHLDLGKRFAIKAIRSEYTQDPDFHSRFDQEAKTQALLQHPNIIQVTDFIKEDGQFFMIMEYVQGKGLDVLIREKQITEDQMLSIVKDILKGLGHAHAKGIIHRDIKPSNIIIAQDDTAKLMDFGIAMLSGESQAACAIITGTPPYMSPEQFNSPEAMDHRGDIYSLGIVMFEMLCGQRPFGGETGQEICMNHMHSKLPEIKPLFAESTPELIRIQKKSLEKKPADRFSGCRQFLESIEAYERQTHIECRTCRFVNRIENKYKLKGEKCSRCGKILSMRSKFTKIWATAFAAAATVILVYLLYPWSGSLMVATTPDKAQVFINNEQKGRAPLNISLEPGSYKILVKLNGGFEEVVRQVEIKKRETTELKIDIPKIDEKPRLAYDNIQKAYQAAAHLCIYLNELGTSERNLEIAKSIGNSAYIEAYQRQIADLTQNIEDGFYNYTECFQELNKVSPEIRKSSYDKYRQSLTAKGENMANLSVVWAHYNQYVAGQIAMAKWKAQIKKFC